MEAVIYIVIALVLAAVIYAFILSHRAKNDRFLVVRVPEGSNVQDLIRRVAAELPRGWKPVGTKKSHATLLRDWANEKDGGNFFDVALGNTLGLYVVSVELSVTTTDEFGRPVDVAFDTVPPQSEYDAHIWVSYATAGQGRMWQPRTSLKIIAVKDYLEQQLSSPAVGALTAP